MGVDADLTYLDERDQVRGRDPNLFYNPVTGYNLDPARFGRPNPAYGQMQWMESTGRTEAMLLSSSLHAPVQEQLPGRGDLHAHAAPQRRHDRLRHRRRTTSSTSTGDWSRSQEFQRDTFRANGIVNLPWQMTVAGSYLYGSGNYYNATLSGRPFGKPGTNRLNIGAPITIPAAVLDRWEGPAVIATSTAWPRNALRGHAAAQGGHARSRADIGRANGVSVTLLAEVFNVFNWKNYGNYNTQLDSASFGQPVASSGNAYVPRSGQLGFRLEF